MIQPDGKIVTAGWRTGGTGIDTDSRWRATSRTGRSTPASTATASSRPISALSDDDARALVIQPDGRIMVVGTAGEDIALARYTPDGKLDTTFGTGGTKITDLGFDDVATGVTLTPDGKIVMCGNTIGAELNNDFLLARYNTNGTLDTTFGTGGTVKTDSGAAMTSPRT